VNLKIGVKRKYVLETNPLQFTEAKRCKIAESILGLDYLTDGVRIFVVSDDRELLRRTAAFKVLSARTVEFSVGFWASI